jgi:SAM-dependent methyltransferase
MKIRLVDDSASPRPLPLPPGRHAYQACPLCQAPGWVRVRVPGEDPDDGPAVGWRGCESCGHVHADAYLEPETALELALRSEHSRLPGEGDVDRARRAAGRIVHRASELRGSIGGAWLDVGSGDGSLVTTAAEFGYDSAALHPASPVVERLRLHGYEAGPIAIEELEGEDAFDVISLDGSLARHPFPHEAIGAAARLLRPGGLLFLSLTNLDSFTWRVLDEREANPHWSDPTRFHQFTRDGLYALLRHHGLEPVDYAVGERYPAEMEVFAVWSGETA